MKTIVVPTDFSASAEHATLYAAQMAKAIDASVLLLHVYQMPVTMTDFPVLIVSAEELKKNADEALKRASENAQKAMPGVRFETESRMGDVVDEIAESCESKEVVAMVAGIKEMSGFERFLLGNTALSIIKSCTYPVITVPEDAAIALPQKMAIALDLLKDEEIPVEKIKNLAQMLQAELHIIHIALEGKEADTAQLPEGLKEARFHSIKDRDVTTGIQHFVEQNNIDLLLVLPHKHNLYERIFFKGHTKDLINHIPVPVACIR